MAQASPGGEAETQKEKAGRRDDGDPSTATQKSPFISTLDHKERSASE